jgi:hypothetical protein
MLFDLQMVGRSNEAKVEAAIWPNIDATTWSKTTIKVLLGICLTYHIELLGFTKPTPLLLACLSFI